MADTAAATQPLAHLPAPTATPAAAAPPGTPTTHVGKYTLYETIGAGAFGKVKLGVNRDTKERVAVKVMDKKEIREQDLSAQVRREIYIMRTLTHKHIVRMHEVLTSSTKLYIVMELVTGGELFERLQMHGRVHETLARRYFQQLVDGVDFCHKSGVAHRDLKPENLLLDEEGNIRITDFGFSSMKNVDVNAGLLYTQCGTPDYCAPEIIERADEGYNGAKVDVWSCGIILYALLVGRLPFRAEETDKLYDMILLCDVTYPSFISPAARDLLTHLLVRDPNMRFTLAEIKRHPWFLVDYTGDDARALKKPAFYHKQGAPTRLQRSAAHQTPSSSDSASASSSPDPSAPVTPVASPPSREGPHSPPASPLPHALGAGGEHSLTNGAARRATASDSLVEAVGRPPDARHPREKSVHSVLSPATITPHSSDSPEHTSDHGGTHTTGLNGYASREERQAHRNPRSREGTRFGYSTKTSPRATAEEATYRVATASPTSSGRVAALVRAHERQASPVDPTNIPPHAVFTKVMDRPATPASRHQPPPPPPPAVLESSQPVSSTPGTSSATETGLRGTGSPIRFSESGSRGPRSPTKSPSISCNGKPERSPGSLSVGTGAPKISPTHSDGRESPSARYENHPEDGEGALDDEPGSSHTHTMDAKLANGKVGPNGTTSDGEGSVEDYQSRPVPTLHLPNTERFGRHQTAQEICHQHSIGAVAVQRHRSDAGMRSGNVGSRMSMPLVQHSPHAQMHPTSLRSNSPSGAAATGGIGSRNVSPFRRQPGGSGGALPTQADARGSLLANRPMRYSESPRQSGSPMTVSSSGAKGTASFRAPAGLPQGSTVPWHDNGASGYNLASPEEPRHGQAPFGEEGLWGTSSDVLSHRLWNVFCRWKSSSTEEPMSPQPGAPELRMEYRAIQTLLQSLGSADEKLAVYEQFMGLFGKDGLGDVASDHDRGGHVGGRMPTDCSSEDDAGWSPIYEPARNKSELARRRDMSDLLTKWMRRYSGGSGAGASGTTGGGSSVVGPGVPSREDSTDGPFGSEDGNISMDMAELRRLMRQQQGGRDDSNLADELERLMKGSDPHALDTGADPGSISSLNGSPPLDGSGVNSAMGRLGGLGPNGEPLAQHTRWSAPIGMSGLAGSGRGRAVSHGDFPGEGSTDAPSSVGAPRGGPVSNSGTPSLASASVRMADAMTQSGHTMPSQPMSVSRRGGRKADMASSMGLDDVEYYGPDKRGVSTKLKGVLAQMKARNQRMVESATVFQSGQEPDSILMILSTILHHMGGNVQLKRETKRKLRCTLPMRGGVLYAVIELTVGENGLTTVAFKRSRQDRGKTDTVAFTSFYDAVRQQFIAEVQSQGNRFVLRNGPSSTQSRRNGAGLSIADHGRLGPSAQPTPSVASDGPASIGGHTKGMRSRTPLGPLGRSPDAPRMTPRAASDMR